jgi:predicted component of type VI protein secretion system
MHAIVGVFKMDPGRRAEQEVALHERIIPLLRQLPGFLSSTSSYDASTSQAHSHVLFETAEQAENFAAFVRGNGWKDQKQYGVEIESLVVAEVIAQVVGDAQPRVRSGEIP